MKKNIILPSWFRFILLFFVILGMFDFIIMKNIFIDCIFTDFICFIYTLNIVSTYGLYMILFDFWRSCNERKKEKVTF